MILLYTIIHILILRQYNADLDAFVHRMQMASLAPGDVVSKYQLDSAMVFSRGSNKYPRG